MNLALQPILITMLEREFQYYKDHQEELVKAYDGKVLLISGEEVQGAYILETEAYLDGKSVSA